MNPHPSRHDVIYSVLLAVLSFFSLIAIVTIWLISTGPALPAGSVLAFRLAIAINICFLLLEVARSYAWQCRLVANCVGSGFRCLLFKKYYHCHKIRQTAFLGGIMHLTYQALLVGVLFGKGC